MSETAELCETHLERGEERTADVVTEDLAMCFDCYGGKPTCRAEMIGGVDQVRERAARRYQQEHREKVRQRMRRWRKKNAKRVREYQRGYHENRRTGAIADP